MSAHFSLKQKPDYGQPCNRCGICCIRERCPVSEILFGENSRVCPALEWDENGSRCGLIASPMKHAPAWVIKHGVATFTQVVKQIIGADTMCDCGNVHDDYDAEKSDARIREAQKQDQTQIRLVFGDYL